MDQKKTGYPTGPTLNGLLAIDQPWGKTSYTQQPGLQDEDSTYSTLSVLVKMRDGGYHNPCPRRRTGFLTSDAPLLRFRRETGFSTLTTLALAPNARRCS
jgi:hypothetical protein